MIAVVTFADGSRLAGYRRHLDLPFRVLADPDRDVYRAFGLRRGRWWTVYGWSTWRRYAELVARGRRLRRPTEDTLQLGGDFVVDRQGRLAYGFWATARSTARRSPSCGRRWTATEPVAPIRSAPPSEQPVGPLFELEQEPLPWHAAAVAHQSPIGADHPVARDDDGDGVATVGQSHRS